MKPREFWIRTDRNGLPNAVSQTPINKKHNDDELTHVREVMRIDWEKVWDDYNFVPKNHSVDRQLIKELIEKQLAGEE